MSAVVLSSLGLVAAGGKGAVVGLALHFLIGIRRRAHRPHRPIRPILILLVVELRSGRSALGALQSVASVFPDHPDLVLATRVATISGLAAATAGAKGEVRAVLSQLARAQRSGAPLADSMRSMVEADVAAAKAKSVARARTLPVRMMIPITLLLLPGLVLLFYAPSMLRLFEELSAPLT